MICRTHPRRGQTADLTVKTSNCVRLVKFYCGFDYVRLSSAIERLVFDWVRLPNCSISTPDVKQKKNWRKFGI